MKAIAILLVLVACAPTSAYAVFNPDIPPVCGWDYECPIDTSASGVPNWTTCSGKNCWQCVEFIVGVSTLAMACGVVAQAGHCQCRNHREWGTGCSYSGVCTYTPNP